MFSYLKMWCKSSIVVHAKMYDVTEICIVFTAAATCSDEKRPKQVHSFSLFAGINNVEIQVHTMIFWQLWFQDLGRIFVLLDQQNSCYKNLITHF